jgi:metal-dependent amidase/aminoacylase/carboxypeptidase family protein
VAASNPSRPETAFEEHKTAELISELLGIEKAATVNFCCWIPTGICCASLRALESNHYRAEAA